MLKNINKIEEQFDKLFFRKRAKIAEKLIHQDLRNGRILDIGCGVVPRFLINTEFKEKYGIDLVIENLNSNNMILKEFDLEKNNHLPFENNFFDVVIMLAVFEHIEERKLLNIFKEVKRILKPGGRLILTTPCPRAYLLLKIMSKLKLANKESIDEHKSIFHLKYIINMLSSFGFDYKKINGGYFEFGFNSWVMAIK